VIARAGTLRLVAFLVIGTVLVAVFFLLVAGGKLFQRRDIYYIDFRNTSVNGLQVGSQVQYNGISVGTVEKVEFAPDSVQHVVVTVSVKQDVAIKQNVKARLQPVGITGTRQIELFGATDQAPSLPAKSHIAAEQSELDQLTQPALGIVTKLQKVLADLNSILGTGNQKNIESILSDTSAILAENRAPLRRAVTGMEQLVGNQGEDVTAIIQSLNTTAANLARTSDSLRELLAQSTPGGTTTLPALLENINNAVTDAANGINTIESVVLQSQNSLLNSVSLLQETLENLNNFSMVISQDPSRLLR